MHTTVLEKTRKGGGAGKNQKAHEGTGSRDGKSPPGNPLKKKEKERRAREIPEGYLGGDGNGQGGAGLNVREKRPSEKKSRREKKETEGKRRRKS